MIKSAVFQKATFRPAKGRILRGKRQPFGKRKAVFAEGVDLEQDRHSKQKQTWIAFEAFHSRKTI